MREIPLEKDWGEVGEDLDIKYAHGVFFGRSSSEAEKLFQDNVIERCGDLGYMPLVPFQYYILSYRDYIVSGRFDDFNKPDAVSCFIDLVHSKMRDQPQYVAPIFDELRSVLEMIVIDQSSYEADVDIYGDFKKTFEEILQFNRDFWEATKGC